MYPRSIKITSDNRIYEYVYSPAYHEDEFEVVSVDNPDRKTIFTIDQIHKTHKAEDGYFSLFNFEIGERILYNEYINFRGED